MRGKLWAGAFKGGNLQAVWTGANSKADWGSARRGDPYSPFPLDGGRVGDGGDGPASAAVPESCRASRAPRIEVTPTPDLSPIKKGERRRAPPAAVRSTRRRSSGPGRRDRRHRTDSPSPRPAARPP